MAIIKVAATQMPCSSSVEENLSAAEMLVRTAAGEGAKIVLLQELFESLYFCQVEKPDFFAWPPPSKRTRPQPPAPAS